jgi:DNA end-binding protein Ku
VAQEAFAVPPDAKAATGTVGISCLVLSRRERAVLLQPCGKGIILWMQRCGAEPKLVSMLQKLIGEMTQRLERSMLRAPSRAPEGDNRQQAERRGGRQSRSEGEIPEPAGNIVSITDALRRSISQEKDTKAADEPNHLSTRHLQPCAARPTGPEELPAREIFAPSRINPSSTS